MEICESLWAGPAKRSPRIFAHQLAKASYKFALSGLQTGGGEGAPIRWLEMAAQAFDISIKASLGSSKETNFRKVRC
jgi:hypothetical protein